MKLSEAIQSLEKIKSDFGDLELIMPHVVTPVTPIEEFKFWYDEPYPNSVIVQDGLY